MKKNATAITSVQTVSTDVRVSTVLHVIRRMDRVSVGRVGKGRVVRRNAMQEGMGNGVNRCVSVRMMVSVKGKTSFRCSLWVAGWVGGIFCGHGSYLVSSTTLYLSFFIK